MIDLRQGDCLEIMKEIPDNSIDCIITSPPYDNLRTYNNTLDWNFEKFKQIALQLYRVLKKGGVVVWVVGDATIKGSETGTSFRQALYFMELGFNLHDTMIYRKTKPIPLNHNRYEQEYEYMFVFSKGKLKTFNPIRIECKHCGNSVKRTFYQTNDTNTPIEEHTKINVKDTKIKGNIWEFANGCDGVKGHPAIFPEKLAYDHIISWTNENDTILDCFMGSGTVGKMCKLTNRNFIGIEIVQEYFEIAKQRIEEAQNKKVVEDE